MAGRFLLQKFSSGTSRSTSLIGAYASTSARAADPIIPRVLAADIKTPSNVFRGAVQPFTAVISDSRTQGNAARYFNTVSGPHAVARTSWPTTGTPSIIINHMKSDFVDCVEGVKRPFSSSSSSNQSVSSEAKRAALRGPDIATHAAALDKTTNTIMGLCTFIGISCIYMSDNSSGGRKSSKNMRRNGSDNKYQGGGLKS